MRIFITESEVLELAVESLDLIQPNPDRIHEIAERMDMVYNEELDLFEDVEEHSLRRMKRLLKDAYHALQQNELNTPNLRSSISDQLTIRK